MAASNRNGTTAFSGTQSKTHFKRISHSRQNPNTIGYHLESFSLCYVDYPMFLRVVLCIAPFKPYHGLCRTISNETKSHAHTRPELSKRPTKLENICNIFQTKLCCNCVVIVLKCTHSTRTRSSNG